MKDTHTWLSVNKKRRCCRLSDEGLVIAKDDTFQNVCCSLSKGSIMCSQSLANGELQLIIKNSPVLHLKAASEEEIQPFVRAFNGIDKSRKSDSDYDIVQAIGCGYFGEVFLVAKRGTNKVYAMKCVHKRRLVNSAVVQKSVIERNILLQASHPFIPKLHQAFQREDSLCLILDYAEGGDLESTLESGVTFPPEQICIYLAEIAITLQYLHGLGIVFRDLKPSNVLICADGHLKLTDFGLAKDLTEDNATKSFCGTNEYLAPEVINGKRYSYAIDWWAMGIIGFRLVTGYLPFMSQNLSRLYDMIVKRDVKFPKTVDEVTKFFLEGLLKKNPAERLSGSDVMHHPYFAGIDWEKLSQKGYEMFVKPDLSQRPELPAKA